MPYIVKKIIGEEIGLGDQRTLILDVANSDKNEKDFRLISYGRGLSYDQIELIKSRFSNVDFLKDINYINDKETMILMKQVENVERFYEITSEKTLIELMFITQYYLSLVSSLASFEKIFKNGMKFDYWFSNNVKYTMLEKIKLFYISISKACANKISMDIYEKDVEAKAKELINKIENQHIREVEALLREAWEETYKEIVDWNKKQEKKRKSILFD